MKSVFVILHRWPDGQTSVMPTAYFLREKAEIATISFQKIEEDLSGEEHVYETAELEIR